MLVVGRIVGAFGVKGWVRVQSFTDPATNLTDYAAWYIEHDGDWQPLVINQQKWQGDRLVVQVSGCDDRNQAQLLTQREIAVDRSELPALAEDDYYWHELQGLNVLTTEGSLLGTVSELIATGANDVLVVNGCAGSVDDRQRLIPYLPGQVVRAVDLLAGTLSVDWDKTF